MNLTGSKKRFWSDSRRVRISLVFWGAIIVAASLFPFRLDLDPDYIDHKRSGIWRSWTDMEASPVNVRDLLANLLLYLPLGLLAPRSIRGRVAWWLGLLAGPSLSALLEALQMFVHRIPNLWDLMMNSLGYLSGYVVGSMMAPYFPALKPPSRASPGGR